MKFHLTHFIFSLSAAVVALIVYGFWYSVVSEKSAAVAGLHNQIAIKSETMSRISSARAILAEIVGDEAAVQSYFVPETGIVSFIEELEAQGKALGTTVRVLSVSNDKEGIQPTFILVLNANGTFDSVMRTVGSIEYAPYDISISKFSLLQDDKNNWNANLDLLVGSVNVATSTP